MYRRLFCLWVALLVLTACSTSAPVGPKIRVENAWARPAAAGSMTGGNGMPGMPDMPGMSANDTTSAVYFVIANEGGQADALIGATTPAASQAELHQSVIQNDVAEMVPVARVDIPAGGRVEFKPGGYHVMLVGLTRDLKVGESIPLTLRFEKSGAITIDVPIRAEGAG
jgi:copper(I)-binding protein